MDELLRIIKGLEGKSFKFSFQIDEKNLLWKENKTSSELNTLSTSALLVEIHRCGFKVLEEYLDKEYLTVVSKSEIKHLSPTPKNFVIYIEINVKEVLNNKVIFEGNVYDELEKVAEFKFERFIVAKNFIERKLEEKKQKLSKY